jgi:hypothetical protein
MNELDLHCSRHEFSAVAAFSSPVGVPESRRRARGTFHKLSQLYVETIQRKKLFWTEVINSTVKTLFCCC